MAYSWAVSTFNPFTGIDVASDCSSNTGGAVSSWLLVVIQCLLPPTPFSLSSLPYFTSTFLGCSEGHPGAHHIIICLSCFASLPSVPSHEICGERAFSVDGTLKRPKRNAESFVSLRYQFLLHREVSILKPVRVRLEQQKSVKGL